MAHALNLQSSPVATTPATPVINPNSALRRFGRSLWRAMETVGQHRAARHLEVIARSVEYDRPELARQFREAARNSLAG